MKRLTYDFCIGGNHCWQVKGADNLECREVCERQGDDGCKTCPIAKAFDRLAAIEDILGDEYDLDRLHDLVQEDREGRCVVLPAKTVFELTWDAGPECDMACPVCIDGAGECDFCDKGKLFVYERPCKQEHIERIGEDVFLTRSEAEAALKAREQDGNNK